MNVYACHMLPEHPPIHLGVEKPYCSLRSFSTVIPPGVIMHNMHKAMYIPVSPRREVPRYVHVPSSECTSTGHGDASWSASFPNSNRAYIDSHTLHLGTFILQVGTGSYIHCPPFNILFLAHTYLYRSY